MIQTILVYAVLTIFMFLLSNVQFKERIFGLPVGVFIVVLIYSVIFGMRYGVGRDYFAYLESYTYALERGYLFRKGEWGFDQLTLLFAHIGFHFSIYFGFIALIQFYSLSLAFKNDKRILPFIFLSFMLLCTFLSWMNGLRQITSLSIFILSINFIVSRKFWHYAVLVLFATLFHTSALILLPLYFLLLKASKLIPSIKYQIILYIIGILFSGRFNEKIFGIMPGLIELMGYSHYADYQNDKEVSFGVGYFVLIFLNLFLILTSDKVRKYLNDSKFEIFYFLFFIGCIWNYLFLGSIPLNRPNYYFYGVNFIVVGYYLYVFYSLRKIKIYNFYFSILISIILLMFVGYIVGYEENTMKYLFYWER